MPNKDEICTINLSYRNSARVHHDNKAIYIPENQLYHQGSYSKHKRRQLLERLSQA
jgi:hypothetical protein